MPCMCGDTMCPSCGPAQGYDPIFQRITEWIEFDLFKEDIAAVDMCWLAEWLGNQFTDQPQYLQDAIYKRMLEYESGYKAQQEEHIRNILDRQTEGR